MPFKTTGTPPTYELKGSSTPPEPQKSSLLGRILNIVKTLREQASNALKSMTQHFPFKNIYIIFAGPFNPPKPKEPAKKISVEERIHKALETFEKGKSGSDFKHTDLTRDDVEVIFKRALQSRSVEDAEIIEYHDKQYVVGETRIKGNLRLYDLSNPEKLAAGCGQTAYKVRNVATGKFAVYKAVGGLGKPKYGAVKLGATLLREIHKNGILRGIEKPPKAIISGDGKMGYLTHYCNRGNAFTLPKLSKSDITDEQKIDGIHQLLCGYAALEKNGIYHADIKADNVLLNKEEDGTWRFEAADFDVFITEKDLRDGCGTPFFQIEGEFIEPTKENVRYLCAQAAGRCFHYLLTGDILYHIDKVEHIRDTLLKNGIDQPTAECICKLVEGKTTIDEAKTEWERIYRNNPLIQNYLAK